MDCVLSLGGGPAPSAADDGAEVDDVADGASAAVDELLPLESFFFDFFLSFLDSGAAGAVVAALGDGEDDDGAGDSFL